MQWFSNRRLDVVCVGAAVLVALVCATATVVFADGSADRYLALEERIAAGDLRYVDARTGEMVVATQERVDAIRYELAPQFDWPSEAEISVAEDGTASVEIEGAPRDVYLVRTNLDGTRDRGCFRDLDAAVAFVVGLDFDLRARGDLASPTAVSE